MGSGLTGAVVTWTWTCVYEKKGNLGVRGTAMVAAGLRLVVAEEKQGEKEAGGCLESC